MAGSIDSDSAMEMSNYGTLVSTLAGIAGGVAGSIGLVVAISGAMQAFAPRP